MAGNIQELIDFDGDRSFSGKDLDITWAYLQTKALFDAGDDTITSDNFRDKVIEQYNANVSSGIAESNTEDIRKLPGRLSLGLPLGVKQINFQKIWTLNDMWNSHDTSGGRNSRKPTDVWESIGGEIAGTTENFSWTSSKNDDVNLTWMGDTAKVSLLDGGTIRSDKSWTLHFKMFTKDFLGVVFKKGEHGTWNEKTNPFFQVKTSKNLMGVYTAGGGKNWFNYPTGTSHSTYKNKWVDFYFVREGQNVRMFLDTGTGPLEAKQDIPGAMPDFLSMNDINLPLIFSGQYMSSLEDVWIADNEFTADDVPYVDKPATRYRFSHDLNLSDSFFPGEWKNLFQDKFENFGEILGKPAVPTDQSHWVDTPTGGTQLGYNLAPEKCLKLSKVKQYLRVSNVNFKSNFTVAFWVRTSSTSDIVRFVGDSANFLFRKKWGQDQLGIRHSESGAEKRINVGSLTTNSLEDTWYHITLVKNRNLIGLWVNGEIGDYDYIGLTDSQINEIGWSSLQFRGDTAGVHYSGVRVLDYAMCNVPARGYGTQSTYEFIDQLKQGQSV